MPETLTLKPQRLDGAWPLVLRSAPSHPAEVGVELQVLYSQEGGHPGARVGSGAGSCSPVAPQPRCKAPDPSAAGFRPGICTAV